eukprot:8176563-Pyramimonas_sp.AAC.1
MCPVRRGAFKQTDCGKWVHVVCAHWMPEVTVLEKDTAIAVEGLAQIPRERYQMLCQVRPPRAPLRLFHAPLADPPQETTAVAV